MRKRTKVVVLAIALIAQSCCSLAHDRLTFRVKASDMRRPSNAYLKNKQPGDTIEITLPGNLFNPPHAVNLISRAQADWSTTEKAVASSVSANTAGDIPWMVECFVPAEHAAAGKRLSTPAAAQTARNYFRNLGKLSITGWTEIRGFTVLFVQGLEEDGDATLISITLAHTPSGWKQTDALANDDTFDLVWTALHTAGVH